LSREEIFDAALALIQASGVEKLSMRSLAQKLGVTAMAIYHHVPNKEALLDGAAEALLATVPTPAPSSDAWELQLRNYALSIWQLLSRYPGMSRVVLERPPMHAVGRLNLYGFSVLRTAGFDEPDAMRGLMSLNLYLAGALSAHDRATRLGRRRRTLRGARPKFPDEVLQFFELLRRVDMRTWTDFGIDTVIAGLRAQRTRSAADAAD
jgi:AcrR family transcriptional regulator